MPMPDFWGRAAFLALATPLCVFYAVDTLFQMWRYYEKRESQFIAVRRYPLALVTCAFVVLFACNRLARMWLVAFVLSVADSEQGVAQCVDWSFFIAVPGMAWFTTFRAYMLMFDSRWTLHMQKHKWQSLICSSLQSEHCQTCGHWLFVAKRNRFGKARVMAFAFAFMFAFHSITYFALIYSHNDGANSRMAHTFGFVMLILMLALYCVIWNCIVSFQDVAGIRAEMALITCIGIALIVLYSVFVLLPAKYGRHNSWAVLSNALLTASLTYVFSYVSLRKVLQFVASDDSKAIGTNNDLFSASTASLSRPLSYFMTTPVPSEVSDSITLRSLLLDMDAVSAFMNHLLLEFSSEHLLALAEMSQFEERFSLSSALRFAEDFPKSSIVHDSTLSMEQIATALIEKYVVEGAQFEVNISYERREALTQLSRRLAANGTNDECVATMFHACVREIQPLLQTSFRRFKQTDSFHAIAKVRQRRRGNPAPGIHFLPVLSSTLERPSLSRNETDSIPALLALMQQSASPPRSSPRVAESSATDVPSLAAPSLATKSSFSARMKKLKDSLANQMSNSLRDPSTTMLSVPSDDEYSDDSEQSQFSEPSYAE